MSNPRFDRNHRMERGGMLAALCALLIVLALPTNAWAVTKVTDPNPSVPQPEQRKQSDESDGPAQESTFYGYKPVEYPTRSIHDANEGSYGPYGPNRSTTLPSSYDARTTGAVMPIRDQNPFGTCWAFSATAASESSLLSRGLMTGPLDFSERQLAYFTYNPVNDPLGNLEGDSTSCSENYLDQGGNERLAGYTLATWSGNVDESLAPYSELVSSSSPYSLTLDASLSREHDSAHLAGMRQIPMNDRDDVKAAIMEYGVLDASVYYSDYYFNDSTNAYYCAATTGTNHAVPIIGWDDDFPRESFAGETYVTPSGQYDLPSSYQTLAVGKSITVAGSTDATNWLVFTPSTSGDYTFYSTDSASDPHAILYRLESDGLLSQIAINDDGGEGYNFSISASLQAGTTYYLDCEDYSSSNASYTVYLIAGSSGSGDPADVDGDVEIPASATEITLDGSVAVQTEQWISFTPSEDGSYIFRSSGTDGDPKATLYAVSTTNGLLYSLVTDDDGGDGSNFSIAYDLVAGNTYYLDCYSYGGDSIAYTVTVTKANSEDGDIYPPTSWSTIAAGESVSANAGDWLQFAPSESGSFTFASTDCGDYDPTATLYVVSVTNGRLISLGENDDGGDGRNFSMTASFEAGRIYYLYCGSYSGGDASYTVTLTKGQGGGGGSVEPPASALPITVGSSQTISVGGTTTVWLRFNPTKDGSYQFSGSSTAGYDITFYGVGSNGMLGTVDDSASSSSGSYSYSVNMKSSITYYLKCVVRSGASYDVSAAYAGEPELKGPSENGAWLVRNSWGTYWGDEGYFWVSYEDTSMNGTASKPNVATIFECEPADYYDNIYQYDGSCNIAYTYISSGGQVANVFTAAANGGGDELLQAVSFWVEDVNVDYSVQVYTGLTDTSNPTSGTAQLSSPVTGKTSYEGYYTVVLPQDVRLAAGDVYSVVVTVSHDDGSGIMFGFDEPGDWGWATFTSSALPGQSFARNSSSSSWTDTSTGEWGDFGNVRLKAFTSNDSGSGDAISIAGATVTCSPASYEYTGSAITPGTVTVTLDGATLRAGSDYSVSYKNNVNVGTATVTVTGRGAYRGTATGTFAITKAKVTAPVAASGLIFTGSAQTGVPAGTGYTLSGTYSATNAGSYTATATLSNTSNYMWDDGGSAAKNITWNIAQANISGTTVAPIGDQVHTGSAITPEPRVSLGSYSLTKNTDYTLSYSNNTNVGTATITITGRGNFTGTKTATFKIIESTGRINIADAVFSMIPDQTYTGSPIEPVFTVRVGSTPLTAGVDYTVSYDNNTDVGTATITITGIGNYEGTASWFFNIVDAGQAVASGLWGTCPWEITSDGTLTIHPGTGETQSNSSASPWYAYRDSVKSVVFAEENGKMVIAPANCVSLLEDMYNAETIDASGLDTSSVTDMSWFFYGCSSLVTLDMSSWDTWNVDYSSDMFYGCESLESWTVGPYYYYASWGMIPEPTAGNGMWLSMADHAWYSHEDIYYYRDFTADTYRTTGGPGNPFIDVFMPDSDGKRGTPHYDDILWLAQTGISAGWTEKDGTKTFRPANGVQRADMAAFLYRLAGSPAYTPSSSIRTRFSDVNERTPHYREIWWLAEMGISTGWRMSDGTYQFRPSNTVVRQDMAAFLFRLAALYDPSLSNWSPSWNDITYFSDVDSRTPHAREVWWLASTGVSAGWTMKDGSHQFRGTNTVIRQDMSAFLYRMASYGLVPELS